MGNSKFSDIHKKYGEILKQKVEKDKVHFEKYEEREKRREKRKQKRALRDLADLKPLLNGLKQNGIEIEHPRELLSEKIAYQHAVPALILHYEKIRDRETRKSILDSLHAKHVFPITWTHLVTLFENGTNVGDLPYQLADKSVYDSVVRLAQSECNTHQKNMLIKTLGKIKNPQACDILIGFLDQKLVQLSAIKSLGLIKAIPARRHLERFIFSRDEKIQQEAVKAITKIDRFIEKSKWSS